MSAADRIALVGAGLIGQRHAQYVRECARLTAIVDPATEAEGLAQDLGVAWYSSVEDYLKLETPDGAILATPNKLHLEHGLAFLKAGVPILIEKPIADNGEAGARLVACAKEVRVPVLVGHHRRHNPVIRQAKELIDSGALGQLVAVNAQFLLYKPDAYFDMEWRRQDGAGPVFINLIHDIDLIRHLCGEIAAVQAMESNSVRGFDVEDTAGVLLRFENGAIGTVTISDTAVAPWSWEFTSGENPAYPHVTTHAYTMSGTHGSLSVPDLSFWKHTDKRGWWEPIERESLVAASGDPLKLQMQHFLDVIAKRATPLVSAEEGLKTLRATEAIKKAAALEKIVYP